MSTYAEEIYRRLLILYYLAICSLSSHAPNWFLCYLPLALQVTGTLHTTWQHSDLIVVFYFITLSYDL